MPPNESDVYIFYKPFDGVAQNAGPPDEQGGTARTNRDGSLKKINPDYDFLFAQPIEMRFNEMLEGTKAELSVKIFGNDYDVLEKLAEQIKDVLEKTPGAAQVEFETEGRTPQLQINAKRDVLQRYGLQAGEVNKAVDRRTRRRRSSARSSTAAGATTSWCACRRNCGPTMRRSRNCPCGSAKPDSSRSASSSSSRRLKTVEPIQHDDGLRRAALMVNLNTRDIEGFVREAERRIKEQVKLPENYIVQFGGQFENLQQARARLAVVVPTALALIFVLIFLAFGSLRQAALVYSGIPLAVTGGVLRALAAGNALQHHGGRGFHRAQRRGGAQRPGDDRLLQPTSRRRQVRTRFRH